MEKLLIIDGNSLINRAFYALPLLKNQDGEYSNAVYGFVNILIKFIIEHNPSHIVVAFDHSRITFRNEIYPMYKGTRKETPIELRGQFDILKQVLEAMHIKSFEINGIEADDIIGTISKNSSIPSIILSGDRDVLQLIDENIQVWLTKKGITDLMMVSNENMQEIYGYMPYQVIEMKSLMGDASDNIPGIKGIGEVTAKNLIANFKTLDGVYENIQSIKGSLHDKLVAGKQDGYMSKILATIKTNCDFKFDLDEFRYDFPFDDNVKKLFEKYEFKTLLKRKEIFLNNNQNIEEKKEIKHKINKIEINNLTQLQQIINNEKKDFFAFNFLNKIEFCFNNNTMYYIDKQTNLFSLNLQLNDVINNLKNIFEDENICKITYDLKNHFYVHDEFLNIKGNIFDISIAMYLIHAGEKFGTSFETEEFADLKQKLSKQLTDLGLDFIYSSIEMPLTYVLYEMEKNGFYIDKTELANYSTKIKDELEDLRQKILNCAGEDFNIKSPKQLATILFDKLHLSDTNNKKHSTNVEVLTTLSSQHEIIPLIIRYRKLQKINSTYIEVYEKYVKEKGECIHTIFNQTLTSTGRLSSSEPNLQNIPVREEEGRNLRKIFVSRFQDGKLVSADYNQIELRLLAHLSKDEFLITAYNNGMDIHRSTASQIFGKNIEDVTSAERRIAKAVNFGIVYGISAYGLGNQLGISTHDAKLFMDSYLSVYKNVPIYMNANVQFAKQNGYISTMFGRRRNIVELQSENKAIKMFGERVAMNMPLQGSASDIIKLAMIKVSRELKRHNLQSKLILQIHDELIVDTKPDELQAVEYILKTCMENVVKLSVPLITNINSGKTWYDAK